MAVNRLVSPLEQARIAQVSGGYPIILDLRDRLVVVIGGGNIALRKVLGLMESAAARIRIVSPNFHPLMPDSSAMIERVTATYRSEHLTGASVVFAATNIAAVNAVVVDDARKMNALVCRADAEDGPTGDFVTPAMLRQDALLITVSSGGSPALSAMVRDRIRDDLDPTWGKMAEAMQSLRPAIMQSLVPDKRKQVFHALCSDEAMAALNEGGTDGLIQWLATKFPEFNTAAN